jgi:predicted transcriptional regulator
VSLDVAWIGRLALARVRQQEIVSMAQKEIVLESVRELPDDVTFREIADRIEFLAGIQVGLDDLDRGQTIPHDEVKRQLASWLTT